MTKDISSLAEEVQIDNGFDIFKYADVVDLPEQQKQSEDPGFGEVATGLGVEVGGGMASQAAGAALTPFTFGVSYPILSFAGGFLSNIAAQKIEDRDEISYGRAIFAGIVNLIPGSSAGKGIAKSSAKAISANIAKGATKGSAIGAGDITAQRVIDDGRLPTVEELAIHGGLGGLLGGSFSGAMMGTKAIKSKLSSKKVESSFAKVLGKTPEEIDYDIATGKINKSDIINSSLETMTDSDALNIINAQKEKAFANEAANLVYESSSPLTGKVKINKDMVISELFPSRILGQQATDIIRNSKQLVNSYEQIGNRINRNVKRYIKTKAPGVSEEEAFGHVNAFLSGGELNDSISFLAPDLEKFRSTLRPLQSDLLKYISEESYTALPRETREILDAVIKDSIDNNNYLTREYRLFIDKDFTPDMSLRQGVADELAKEMVAGSIDNTTGKASIKLPAALEAANKHIDELIDESARSRIQDPKGYVPRGIAGILKEKRDVGPKLKEFLGEVTDPGERMLGTLSRVGRLTSSMEADNKLIDYMVKSGIAAPQRKTANQVKLNLRSIANSELYVDPEIGHAVNKLYINDPFDFLNDKMSKNLFDVYNTLVGASKASKVVFNPVSYAAQAWGNLFSLYSSGIIPTKANMNKGLRLALSEYDSFDNFFTNKSNKVRSEFLDEIGEMSKYGLTDNTVITSDIRNSLERGMFAEQFDKFMSPFGKAYSAADTAFRYAAWKGNQKALSKIFPNLDKEQLKDFSATLTNNTYQNYSRVSDSLKKLSRLGALQQFFVFNGELIRNMYNQGRYINKMLNGTLGDDFGVPIDAINLKAMRAEGARRLFGITSVLGLSGGGITAYNMVNDVSGDTEEAFKETLAPGWDSGKRLGISIDKENGTATYFNPSYLIPHSIAISAFDAGFNESPIKSVGDFVVDEFIGKGSFVFESASQAVMGIDDRGKIISPSETNWGQLLDRTKFFVNDLLEPGLSREAKKWDKAMKGKGNYSPEQLSLRMLGIRYNNLDIKDSAKMKIKQSVENMKIAKGNYSVARDYRDLDGHDLDLAYQEANNYRQESFNSIRKHYLNLKNPAFGLSNDHIVQVLKDSGMSSSDILSVIEGEYKPLDKTKTPDTSEIYSQLGERDSDKIQTINQMKRDQPELAKKLFSHHKSLKMGQNKDLSEEDKLLFSLDPSARADYLLGKGITFRSPRYRELRGKGIINGQTARSMKMKYRSSR